MKANFWSWYVSTYDSNLFLWDLGKKAIRWGLFCCEKLSCSNKFRENKSGYVISELNAGSCEQNTKLETNFCSWYVRNLFLRCGFWGGKHYIAEGFVVKNFHVSIFSISTMSEVKGQKMSRVKGQQISEGIIFVLVSFPPKNERNYFFHFCFNCNSLI